MANEDGLLGRARARDQDALAQIYDAYYGAIYRYISFRVDDLQTVQDLTSEVFTRFLVALRKRLGQPNSIGPWLYGTASRVVKEHYRRQSRQNEVTLDESIAVESMGPHQSAEEMWTRRELHKAIQKLTEDQQIVLALHYGASLPIKEVARLIRKSEGAVKMLQARAISALACRLVERK
ncbi:MAG: sigma-70 family RNA polymerase sigma factor [Chloroflexi bacterium]|nr:MAG: sigma-70 family RNA polymerase sigma factor [Chloroflexota bacterium]